MTTKNSFIDPGPMTSPGNYDFAVTIPYGSPQDLSWTTNYDIPLNLTLIQETAFLGSLPAHIDTLSSSTTATGFTWDGRPTQDLSLSRIFFLAMYNSSNPTSGPLFTSQYMNITSSASSSSTTTTPSSTTSPPPSSSPPAPQPTTTPPSASTAAAAPTGLHPPKSTADHVALGAGLGAGLGGAALIVAIALFCFVGRKRPGRGGKGRVPEVYQLAENDTFSR